MIETTTTEQILSKIAKIRWMLPGSIGRTQKKNKHGETVTEFRYYVYGPGTKKDDKKPRTHTWYVRADNVAEMEMLIAEGKRFDELVARYRELIFAETRRERQLPRKPKRKRKATPPPPPPPPEQPITVS